MTWDDADPPDVPPIGPSGWLRVGVRGGLLGLILLAGLAILLLIRAVERPLCGLGRPVSPFITQAVCRAALFILGIAFVRQGQILRGSGAVVANHSSWLDIFALNAGQRMCFVAKSEVAAWPGIGWLARATGTVFIRRDPRDAASQIQVFVERLKAGHRLVFFPEGTSTDGLRVLPFKATLFAAFFDPALRTALSVQPVTVVWQAGAGADPRHYGWWGKMDFGPHALTMLATAPQGRVTVIYHPPLRVADFADRKALAQAAERSVRSGLPG